MLLTLATFFFVLGVLVLVHEFGHFLAAKRLGIKVEEFGVGFPPRIWGKKIGETLYSINLLPIGGFVRLFGEDEAEASAKFVSEPGFEKKRAFFAKTPLERSSVLIAGVVMNFLLGWLIISFLFTQGVMTPTDKVHIDEVEKGSPADIAGLLPKDVISEIKSLDGSQVFQIKSSKQLVETTDKFRGREIILAVEREGTFLDLPITPREKTSAIEGAMGVVVSNFEEKVSPPHLAPFLGLKEAFNMSKQLILGIADMVIKLVTFRGVNRDIAGPVGIAELTGQAVKFGKLAVLELMGLLSLNLAIINLLPIPALDGGRLLFVALEGLTKKKVKPAVEKYMHQIGLLLLLTLLVFATINDILRLLGR